MTVRMIDTVQKRLRILGEDEIDAIYGRPRFTHEERTHYLSLAEAEKALLGAFRSIKSRAYFVLQLGYFKAKHLFFVFDLCEVETDFRYVLQQHFDRREINDLGTIDKTTRLKQQQLILELFNYRSCDAEARQQLIVRARQVATVSGKPIYLFRELMHYLAEQRIVLPGYSRMQEIIGQALNHEQNRLIELVRDHLTASDIEALKELLADSPGLYEITRLKHEPRDFSVGEIKREIHRGERIRPLYRLARQLLPVLKISNESIGYYASLVGYYSVYKLKRLNQWLVYVYLLCFVTHRYQRLHDNLINSFLYNVRRYVDEAKSAAKEKVYECHVESSGNLKKAGQVLKLFTDDRIKADTPFRDVRNTAFAILEPRKLNVVVDQIASHAKFDEIAFQWEHVDELARQFKQYLRPIIRAVDFAVSKTHDPLLEALEFLKAAFNKGRPLGKYSPTSIPVGLIPDNMKRYLHDPATDDTRAPLLVDRYEFWIYRLLRNGLEAGDVFCRDSVRFRSFEDDLIEGELWRQKDRLIDEAGLPILKQPIRVHLAELEQRLEARIVEVNRRIDSGENEHLQLKQRGRHRHWVLRSPRSAESINNPFFDALKQSDIGSILHFVNQDCRFISAFEHVLGRYTKQDPDDRVLMACLIAWGTNLGLGRMAEISDISYASLATTSDSFIRPETLHEANDRVSNRIAELPIFRHYDIDEALHSSSDGQKFETHRPTINARHSPKYFGLKKGVVAYTLVANHVPVNARIIGANEHESHYVFDLLFNNTTDIQPEVHSTDTHGTNQVNFAILHLFGYQFAPRYRDIHDRVSEALYGFQHPSRYTEGLIKPIRKINAELVVDEWDSMQRIILSLALKTTTQSIIVGKLSAHARKNKTKRALWEYDNIIKSLYLLDYIDSLPLRQNVRRALNRGENYHKLRRAVSYANFGKLRFKTEQEQQLWNDCSRLITNCIIYYNASLLSKLLVYKEKIGDQESSALLKNISPVAWQHLNFYGRYEFNNQPTPINMDAIVRELAQFEIDPEPLSDTDFP